MVSFAATLPTSALFQRSRSQVIRRMRILPLLPPNDDVAALFLDDEPELPAGWELVRGGRLVQMVCPDVRMQVSLSEPVVPLEKADFPEMVALAAITEPGPFRDNTATLVASSAFALAAVLPQWQAKDWRPRASLKSARYALILISEARGYAQHL